MWYSASLLFSSEHVNQPEANPLWEEQVVIFQADDEDAARHKAEVHGKAEEHEYRNAENHLVRWRFERVERIFQVESETLSDGTEVFSRFLRDAEVKSLLTPFDN
jgi:hypothetical protein